MSTMNLCWHCGSPFVSNPTGRKRRYCRDSCRLGAKRTRAALAAAAARDAAAVAHRARTEASLIQRYGTEGAAALLRVMR